MTVLKKISVINENKSFTYSILIGNNFIQILEKNFSKTLKGKKIYIIYDEFFYKLQLHENLIKDFEKLSIKLGSENFFYKIKLSKIESLSKFLNLSFDLILKKKFSDPSLVETFSKFLIKFLCNCNL